MDVPEFNTDDVTDAAHETARNLIPWLPDPHTCQDCGTLCKAGRTFDPLLVEATDCWRCPECGAEYYRERY